MNISNADIFHPTCMEIDLSQFRKNLGIIRKAIGARLFCLPIKANAYGHGLIRMGQEALSAGVDMLGVAHLKEGVSLRQSGIKLPILVFGVIFEEQVGDLQLYDLEFSISSKAQVDFVSKHLIKKCRVHVEVETGMQRTGVQPQDALDLVACIRNTPNLEIVGVYSHLAAADQPNDPAAIKQISEFKEIINQSPFQGICAHLANSGGVIHYPESYLDMVRPGLMSYGYLSKNVSAKFEGIAPCLTLKSTVSFFKTVPEGTRIGYGQTFITDQKTGIATVPIGYGDGYLRALSNRAMVLIGGEMCPIVGAVCMDQLMVCMGTKKCAAGDEVVLIGKQSGNEIKLIEIANICNTIPYEVMCLLNERVSKKFYHGDSNCL